MPPASEQISQKWIEGADRTCCNCGVEIKNLARQVGVVRSEYRNGKVVKREITCMDCRPGMKK